MEGVASVPGAVPPNHKPVIVTVCTPDGGVFTGEKNVIFAV